VTGSSYIPIVVPIVAFAAMAFWLGLVFYAEAHPGYKRRTPRRRSRSAAATTTESAHLAPGRQHEALPQAGVPAGPREHERIDEPASGAALR
jgi:hypothetical protein